MKFKQLLALLSIIFILSACDGDKKAESKTQEVQKVKIEVATAKIGEVEQTGTFTATVQAEIVNNIAPQMAARITKTYVEVGDNVKVGQKLVEMDAVNLEQLKLQMDNNKIEFDRVDELYKVGGISKAVWDSREMAYEISKTSYQNMLENTTLVSPINGIITQRNYDSGDMYTMSMPIYVVEQINPVKLMVDVSESLFPKIKIGMEVGVTLDVYDDKVFKGIVKLIHPTIDPLTRTFTVEISIKNSDKLIRPGMFARVTFDYGDKKGILVLDRAIVKQSGSAENYVFVIKDGVAEFRNVVIGTRMGDTYEIKEGLEAGEIVAITGQGRLNSGSKVEIVK